MRQLGIVFLIILLISCKTLQECQIQTANKVEDLLLNGDARRIQKLFFQKSEDLTGIGKNTESIEFDIEKFRQIIQKYGKVNKDRSVYKFDKSDYIFPYKIEYPIFTGVDTIKPFKIAKNDAFFKQNHIEIDTLTKWRITKISLIVYFGPEQVNKPSKIANYEILIEKDILNE